MSPAMQQKGARGGRNAGKLRMRD